MVLEFENLFQGNDLDREQRKAMLRAVDEKKLVVDPEHLDPVLARFESALKALRGENQSLRSDVMILADACQLLVHDNNTLRSHLEAKNPQMQQLIENIGEHEGSLVQNLRANISVLSEEISALQLENSRLKEIRMLDVVKYNDSEEQFSKGIL